MVLRSSVAAICLVGLSALFLLAASRRPDGILSSQMSSVASGHRFASRMGSSFNRMGGVSMMQHHVPTTRCNKQPHLINSMHHHQPQTSMTGGLPELKIGRATIVQAESGNVFMDALQSLQASFGGGASPSRDGKRTAVITGASSGLGLAATKSLIESGDWHVIMGVRNPDKAEAVAEEYGFPKNSYSIEPVELESFESVRKFASRLRSGRQVDSLVCNAALYLPASPEASYTVEGYETSAQVNHLSHFLLVNLMLPVVQKSKDPRIVIVGSITGNTNTVGGGAVWPWADLGKLNGLAEGGKGVPMMDGGNFNGAKAYKDSKLANMMTMLEAHRRFHDSTGITFSSLYPGCIAESALFRDKKPWFRKLFPLFMKYVTGGYVSEPEAGDRLAQVVSDPRCQKSGVYWSWNGGAKTVAYLKVSSDPAQRGLAGAGGSGGEIFENEPSDEVRNPEKGKRLWELSSKMVGLPYDKSYTDVLPETAAEIAAKNGPKSLPGIPLPNWVPDSRGKLDKRAAEGTSSKLLGGRQ
mmetsp:Transcript_4361/g.7946  ORF Transcript_4361/g.7946 Transcript_4361/m.7946 type:complete len:526 (+) Transcript_4361:40-1617(+)